MECSGLPQRPPAPEVITLDEFASGLRERVLPVLKLFQSRLSSWPGFRDRG